MTGSRSLAVMTLCLVVGMAIPCSPRRAKRILPIGTAPVVINEVLASNSHTGTDPQGQYDDWIELYNRGDAPVNLAGMYLTDDLAEPMKWQFPKNNAALTTIPARGCLLVWADGDVADAGLHASFKLSASGESVGLVDRDGMTVLDSVSFGPQRTDISYGRLPDGAGTWTFLPNPSPGGANFSIYQGFVETPQFSVRHGFYTSEIQVSITCTTPDASIYYTTDGSSPYLVERCQQAGDSSRSCLHGADPHFQDYLPAGDGDQDRLVSVSHGDKQLSVPGRRYHAVADRG